jgi:peroxiredoxin
MSIPVTNDQLTENFYANKSDRLFYITPGKIAAAGNRLEDLVFSGTSTMNEFMKLENSKRPFIETSMYAGKIWRETSAKADFPGRQDSLDVVMKKIENAAFQLKLSEKTFIKQHPASLLSMALLKDMILQVEASNVDELESMIAGLSPKIRKMPGMMKYIERLKSVRSLVAGKPILDFSMPDTSGKKVSPGSFRGKWLLVEFWASWCGPCRMEIPNLLKEYAGYKEKNFEILGVSLDDNRSKWLKAIGEEKLPWTQVADLKGLNSDVIMQYGITSIPLNYLVDPDGIIVAKNLRGEELGKKLKELLK